MTDAPKMHVKCRVANCHYWKDSMCHANSIEVDAMGHDKADTSDGTCCETFKKG